MSLFSGILRAGRAVDRSRAPPVGWGFMPPEQRVLFGERSPLGGGPAAPPMPMQEQPRAVPPGLTGPRHMGGHMEVAARRGDNENRPRGVGGFLRGLGNRLNDPEFGMGMARAQALIAGDYAAASNINAQMARIAQTRQEGRQDEARRESLMNNLVKQGMDPGMAELVMTDPESFGRNLNERFGTRVVGEGDTVHTGGINGQPSTFRAPKTYEQGADTVNVEFNGGGAPQISRVPGMTSAEQEARSLGLQPGTPQFNTYIQDRNLGAQGPTAGQRQQSLEAGRMTRHTTPRAPAVGPGAGRSGGPPRSEQALYVDLMGRHQRGERLNVEQREWIRAYEARQQARIRGRGRQQDGGAGSGQLREGTIIDGPQGPMIRRNGQWVRHSG